MKIWFFLALAVLPLTLSATPITYQFSGYITDLRDSYDNGYSYDPGFHDWWPEVGDRYSGTVTFDSDTIVYDDVICLQSDVCGGLVSFEMYLGDGKIALQTSFPFGLIDSSGPTSFVAWVQGIREETSGIGFDSFFFEQGSFRGVDSAYWDGISGQADSFVQVFEPGTFGLLLLSLLGIGYKRYSQSTKS
jgi:hypothetical protein